MPRIAILSAQGESSFTPEQRRRLAAAGETRFVVAPAKLTREDLVTALEDAEVAGLTPRGTPPLDDALLAALPRLRAVALPTTGTEWIAMEALQRRSIVVRNLPGYSSDSTAEFTWALLLAAARHVCQARERVLTGRAQGSLVGFELRGKTLGVVGMGGVGKRVAGFGEAFGMKVLGADLGAPLDEIFRQSDVVSLHVPLNAETQRLFGEERLRSLKRTALLVNTARPGLVSLPLVVRMLDEDRLRGYAFDAGYVEREQLLPWVEHPRVLAVPHIAWLTRESMAREIEGWVANLLELL